MRYRQRLFLLTCTWLALSGSPALADADACLATRAALAHLVGSKVDGAWELQTTVSDFRRPYIDDAFVRQDFPEEDPDDEPFRWFVFGDDGETAIAAKPPSVQMAHAFLEQDQASATDCSSVLEFARESNVTVGTPTHERPRRKANGLYDRTFVELTKAVVSPDGTEALMFTSLVSGPLAGGGYLLLFRRNESGAWEFAGQLGVWIS